MKRIWIIAILLLTLVLSGQAQKAFRGAEGFGSQTRGAYSGSTTPTILIVDTLSSGVFSTGTNRGTLRWAIAQNYPRIIVFEVGGTINFSQMRNVILVDHPYLTIYGQTAPSPGIIIRGTMFHMTTNDIIIQNMKFRHGDDVEGLDPNARDGLSFAGCSNVVIDHCSFQWSIDELLGIAGGENITVTNCIIAEALTKSLHYDDQAPEWHGYGILNNSGTITIKDNLIAFTFGRNPGMNSGTKAIINNFIYATRNGGPMIYGTIGEPVNAAIIGNYIQPITNCELNNSATRNMGLIMPSVVATSRIFLEDNSCQDKRDHPGQHDWAYMANFSSAPEVFSAPFDLSGFTIRSVNEVEAHVLEYAGAFRWDRDYVDTRVVNHVRNRTGELINSPFSLPAMAYKWEINRFTGRMNNGFNWADTPQTLIVNGTTLTLNQNTTTIDQVVAYLNTLLPSNLEAYQLNNFRDLDFVGIRTRATGSTQILSISGSACETMGIPPGTYHGTDGNGYNFGTGKHSLTMVTNPHATDADGYTNLENWVASLPDNSLRSVTFQVTDSETNANLAQARISIAGQGEQTTNLNGLALFSQIEQGTTISYSITCSGYNTQSGSASIETNQTVNIRLIAQVDAEAPTTPGNFSAVLQNTDAALLSWNAATDNVAVSGYKIYHNGVELTRTTQLTYTNSPLEAGTSYSYSVSAYDARGNESAPTATLTVTTPQIVVDNQPPTTPTSFSGTYVEPNRVYLDWNAATDNVGVAQYRVYRDGVQLAQTTSLHYNDLTAAYSTTYQYRVSAVDAVNNESSPATVNLTTPDNPNDTEAPGIPANARLLELAPGRVQIAWDAATDNIGVIGYIVYRNDTEIGRTAVLTYSDINPPENTLFRYAVAAYDAFINVGSTSNVVTITTFDDNDNEAPSVPGGLQGQGVSTTQVHLSWQASTDNTSVSGYTLYRGGAVIATTVSTSYTDDGLIPDTEYSYSVSASDPSGNESNTCTPVSATTLANPDTESPTTPQQLQATAFRPDAVHISWAAATDNVEVAGYTFFRNGSEMGITTQTSFTDSLLNPQSIYEYAVLAWDQAGNQSAVSATDTAYTPAPELVFYINPESDAEGIPDGSLVKPYTSWSQVTWIEGYTYKQRRGTASFEPKLLVTAGNIRIGSYGQGDLPRIVTTATDYAISIFDKNHITISEIDLDFNSASGGIYFAGTENDSNVVEKCKIAGSNYGIRIVGGNHFIIRYNEIRAYLSAIYSLASTTEIYYNELIDAEVAVNINDYSSEVSVFNNVFASNYTAISSSYGGLTLFNNIFSLDKPGSIAVTQQLDSLVSDYNIFYPAGSGFMRIGGTTYDDLVTYQNRAGTDAHSMDADPLFLDFWGSDFRIDRSSPAAEAGVDIGLKSDKFESAVPHGHYPEIGIQEITDDVSRVETRPKDKDQDEVFALFPNPNNGVFSIMLSDEVPNENIRVSITNLQGTIIFTEKRIAGKTHQFHLNNLPAGQYHITVGQGRISATRPLLIID